MKNKKIEFERLYDGIYAGYENSKTLYHEKNDLQEVILFENNQLGRVLMLDGITQVTLFDEFAYHEMMTHTPILSHDNPKKVLIIGGDGGIAREALRHEKLEKVTMIEIDQAVVEFSKIHLPEVSNGAFDNSKLDLRIEDGAKFVAETDERYDVIIVDSNRPARAR